VLVRRGPFPASVGVGRIEALELPTLARHSLVEGTNPQLAATGDLLFEQHGGIWTMRFDAKRLSVTRVPVPIVESVPTTAGNAQFSTAGDGSRAYIAGNTEAPRADEVDRKDCRPRGARHSRCPMCPMCPMSF
jgi:hypothetical protein